MVRGFYRSIEMIREIPLVGAGADNAKSNSVDWIMVRRSDPGDGIPRFMVDGNVPGSIVQDALKFWDWACAKSGSDKSDSDGAGIANKDGASNTEQAHDPDRKRSGVGTSIVDRPSNIIRRASHRAETESTAPSKGILDQIGDSVKA
jgi:hypothetical protein